MPLKLKDRRRPASCGRLNRFQQTDVLKGALQFLFGGDYNSGLEGLHTISPLALDAAMDAQRVYRAHLVNLADVITRAPLSADLGKASNLLYEYREREYVIAIPAW